MRKFFDNLVERTCFVLVIALAVIVFVQVFNRYVLKTPLAWSEELAMLIFQWVTFLGAAIGVRRMSHFGIDLLVERLSEKARRRIEILIPIFIGIVAITMITEGYKVFDLTRRQYYTTMDFSRAWAYAAIPVSGALMILYLVEVWIRSGKKRKEGKS